MKRKLITTYKCFDIYDDGRKITFQFRNFRFTADSIDEAQAMIDELWEEGVDE